MRLRAVLGLTLLVTLLAAAAPVAGATVAPLAAPSAAAPQSIGAGSCIGDDACLGATGDIGEGSCIGDEACKNATGNIGDGSCNYGGDTFAACEGSSADIGDNSCNILGACRTASGTIGNDSCNGNGACSGSSATIGDGSCNTGTACPGAAGSIGGGSCNEFASCLGAAATIGNNACNGFEACVYHPAAVVASDTCNSDYGCSRQPDALIRLAGKARKGSDIYNLNGAGQSVNVGPRKFRDGAARWFYVYAFNDGYRPDTLRLLGEDPGSDAGYEVRYFRPSGADITAAVEAGTFTTPDLAAGDRYAIRVKVTVTSGAAHGSRVRRLITVTSEANASKQDAVGITVRRR